MSSSNPNMNKKLPQRIDKYLKSGSTNNTNKFTGSSGNNLNLDQLSKTKARPDSHNLRQKEEGFSVYLMGANEERIKNMRKKELKENSQKSRPKNNSRSIANRKKWDLSDNKFKNINNVFNINPEGNYYNNDLINDNNINNNLNQKEIIVPNASRSKSRKQKQESKKPIAAHIDYKAISKLILNNNNSTAIPSINFNHRSNHNYELNNQNNYNFNNTNSNNLNNNNINSSAKNVNSKDSITNLEEMLNDIHTVNRNITNINKFNLNSESPINKRRRNWGEPKYNIVFPDLSSSIEKNFAGSSKNKKQNITNYSNNVISNNNNLNSSFNKITENEIDGYNSVLGREYSNLNSSIAGVSKERDIFLSKAKNSNSSNHNSNNNNLEDNSVNYANISSSNYNLKNNNTSKNSNFINLTHEKNSFNSNVYINKNTQNTINNNFDNLNNNNNVSTNFQLILNKNQNQLHYNSNNKNIIQENENKEENSNSTTNFQNSGTSLILSKINHSSNNGPNYNKNTYSSNSNQNINSNPDMVISSTFQNNKNKDSTNNKNIIKNFNLQNLKNLTSNKEITSDFLYEDGNSGIITNRYWEATGASANRKNFNLNNINEPGKHEEVMLVLENLNNSEILNISNSGFNNNLLNQNSNNNINNTNNLENQNNLTGSTHNYNYNNAKVNSETGVKINKINLNANYNNKKKYSNISVNLNPSNNSNLNSKKFISLNSNKEKERKIEEHNLSSNKNKVIPGLNLISKLKLNNISNNNINNPNLSANNNINNLSNFNNNTTDRPFSSIVNLSKLKTEKLKISDLNDVTGISPKSKFPSIQFIYKSPQNINMKSGQRPLSHIQKSKSTLHSKTSTNCINNNIFSNNNSNTNVVNQMLGNAFEKSHNPYNFKNSNIYSTMDRFSSREKQSNFFNNINNSNNNINRDNFNQKIIKANPDNYNYNNINSGGNLYQDNPNLNFTNEISNTQFNFSRKKNQYPTISNVQKLSGNNLSNNINNNSNINNLNNVLSNLINSRNPSSNSKNKSYSGNTSNMLESNVVLSSSNYKEVNNYNTKNSENSSSNKNIGFILNSKHNNNISNSNITKKPSHMIEKKTDLLQHLEKLDDKKIKKVFKYIERLSENNCDNSDISMIESRNFLEKQGKNIDKLNINYIKTDSINFGNININVNNNPNSNVNNTNIIKTASTGINHINCIVSKESSTHNIKKEFLNYNDNSKLVKKKIVNINNSVNGANSNSNFVNTTQGQKSSFSSSMKERNKKYQTLEEEAVYASDEKDEIFNNNDTRKSSSIKNFSAISLLIHSNWGNIGKCGLTEIQLLDEKNRKIDIKECHVFNGSEDTINRITNDKFNSTDENDMWLSNFTGNLRLEIYFEPTTKVDRIVIWNFNGKDLSKGIREVDIIRRNKIIWKGIIQKGTNASKSDYSTKIKLEKENSITNFDFINLIYKESLENFDFLSSTINSPSKSLMKSNTGIHDTNHIHNSNLNKNINSLNLNVKKKISHELNKKKINNNNKINLNKTEFKSNNNIFVENNLSYNNSKSNPTNNENIISEDFLRNSVSSVGNAQLNFESLNASSSARQNHFNKLITSSEINKNLSDIYNNNNNSNYNNKNINNLTTSQSLKIKNAQLNKNINFKNNFNNINNINQSNSNNNIKRDFSSVNTNNNDVKIINNTNDIGSANNLKNNHSSSNNFSNLNLIKSQSCNLDKETESESTNNYFFKTSINLKSNQISNSAMTSNINNNPILDASGNPDLIKNNNDMYQPKKENFNNSSDNKLNIYSFSSNNNSLFEPKKTECLTCKRMKIILRSSYGDTEYIGLTGIQFFDENEEPINIEKAKTIGALPKDINTYMNNCGDPRIFENVFNLINETNDDNYMWLTVYNAISPPYIEISYEDFISISSIKFWNYNKNGDLHRGVKIVDLILDEDYKNQITIVLRKGIGEDNVDYSQTINFPYKINQMTEEEVEPFQNIKPASLIYNQDFETPYLPTGFNLKLSLISNWGDSKYIGFSRINIYDQCGNQILPKNCPKIIQIPIKSELKTNQYDIDSCYLNPNNLISNIDNNININKEYLVSSTNENKRSSNLISSLIKSSSNSFKSNLNSNNKYWITEFIDTTKSQSNSNLSKFNSINEFSNNQNSLIKNDYNNINVNFETLNNMNIDQNKSNNNNVKLNTFSKLNNRINNDQKQNLNDSEFCNNHFSNFMNSDLNCLYFIFDKPITIGFIEIINLQDKPERGIKEIQFSLDENIIYKGSVKKFNSKNSNTCTILFSSENKITKLINLKTLNKANLKNCYVYKQNTKSISSSEQKEIEDKFNFNKIDTFNGKSNRSNFSPTFNLSNNNAAFNTILEKENEQSCAIVHHMILESESKKHDNESLDSCDI